MEAWLVLFLGINIVLTILYGFHKFRKKQNAGLILLFLFLPILGFIIYLIPHMVQNKSGKEYYDRESLVKRFEIEKSLERPDMEMELNVVPIEDAMAVSKNVEKRSLLLNQLKKDIYSNYKELIAAENDKDSESAHYVAAAKMEVYRSQQKQWMKILKEYEENPESIKHYTAVMYELRNFIDSRLMSNREQNMYKKKYCDLMEGQLSIEKSNVFTEGYVPYLTYLIELEQYEKAEKFWEEKKVYLKNETCYMKMMEMYYKTRDKQKFTDCMRELQADSQIRLSAEGLNNIRYWLGRKLT